MSAILQIVDGPSISLVLELNGWSGSRAGLVKRGLNLTEGQVAALDDATNWSPLAGPTPLGRRRITVPFVLVGLDADDLGARVAKLMHATQGPWWLRIRRDGATQDSWLQCYGCVPQVNSQVTASTVAHIAQGTISCETAPYAIGARVDGSAAVGQDPSAAAWGVDINGVAGDTATPLLIRMRDESVFGDIGAFGAWISVRRRGTPSHLTSTELTIGAEDGANSLVNGPGLTMTVQTGDTAMADGGYVRSLFSDAYAGGTAASITFAGPTLGGRDAPGTYRCFVRIRRDAVAKTQQLVLKAFSNGSNLTPEDVTVPANGSSTRLVDLGLIQWPPAAPAGIAAPILTPSGANPDRVTLQFWRKSSGAARVDFDYMCWIPADEDGGYLDVDGPLPIPVNQCIVVDGYQQQAMVTSTDPINGFHTILGQSYGSSVPGVSWTGGVPRVGPGSNRLFVVAGLSPITSYPIASNVNVAWSYWPRWTWLK